MKILIAGTFSSLYPRDKPRIYASPVLPMSLNDKNHPHETQERYLMWLKAREANLNIRYYIL